jgi:hypothetical protein
VGRKWRREEKTLNPMQMQLNTAHDALSRNPYKLQAVASGECLAASVDGEVAEVRLPLRSDGEAAASAFAALGRRCGQTGSRGGDNEQPAPSGGGAAAARLRREEDGRSGVWDAPEGRVGGAEATRVKAGCARCRRRRLGKGNRDGRSLGSP